MSGSRQPSRTAVGYVSDILEAKGHDVLTVDASTTVLDAVKAMVEGNVGSLVVTVDSESDDRGILGLDPSVPAGPLDVRITIAIEAPGVDDEQLTSVATWGVEHCPVTEALGRPVPVEVVVEVVVGA